MVEYLPTTISYYRRFKRKLEGGKNNQNIVFRETLAREKQEITKYYPKRSVQYVPRYNHSEFPNRDGPQSACLYTPMLKRVDSYDIMRSAYRELKHQEQ